MRYGERKIRNRMRHARMSDVFEALKRESTGPIRIISWDFTIVGENEDEILFVVFEVEEHAAFDDVILPADFRWAVFKNGRHAAGG